MMHAIMLAAGRGMRLSAGMGPPKALLEIGGKTLLRRHIETLTALGIGRLTVVVGYRADAVHDELAAIGAGDWVETVFNPRFTEGAVVSLWAGRHVLRGGRDVLFMDADVLYDPNVLRRVINSPRRNCFLIDRDLEPGMEPVKLCLRGGRIVEFGKIVEGDFEVVGEWPGFLRLEARVAAKLAAVTEHYVSSGRGREPYEPAMRDVLLAEPPDRFGWEDVTGMPWIEIDTPEDLRRAEESIAPRLRGSRGRRPRQTRKT
jgi:choline kinase